MTRFIAFYARGLPVRQIQAFLKEMYAVDVSPDLIGGVTDAIVAEVRRGPGRWSRSIPVVFCDALRVKIRDETVVRARPSISPSPFCPKARAIFSPLWIE